MNGRIFVDTSAWLSYSFEKESHHHDFTTLFLQAYESHSPLYTSNDIVDETYTRLRYDVGWYQAKKFINFIQESKTSKVLSQIWTDEHILAETFKLLDKYQDHKLSLTDATSAILMKKSHISTILTLDHKHFTTLGFRTLPVDKLS